MTLLELSALYDESATRIRVRMAQLRADAKEQTDPAAAQALRQRIAELTPMLREMRELAGSGADAPAEADAHALLRSGDEYSSDRRTAGAQSLHGVPHSPPGTGAALPPCALRTVNLFVFPLVLFSPSPYNRLR